MFIPLVTARGENLLINAEKILYFAETKRGCSVVLDDGTMIDLGNSFSEIIEQFEPVE